MDFGYLSCGKQDPKETLAGKRKEGGIKPEGKGGRRRERGVMNMSVRVSLVKRAEGSPTFGFSDVDRCRFRVSWVNLADAKLYWI